ncbi:hypothetical protein PV620_30190 [Streptomyces sp. ME02-6978a]|uniref:hypothetical protein n=1 Tax=unclassified Streptomyces TaxID=2593676 RepID=UPI0029AADF76|nr:MULTISPECIES: hypothetical protein [unclassified Streptomyces]MDX3087175.1 hypothetical protein [Streptomyces sp. ME12-02E]MDX3335818.1 hypothetical protein [Streptomyces sp. ME02-6978a]
MAIEVITDDDGEYTERVPDTAPATEPDDATVPKPSSGYSEEPPFPTAPASRDTDLDVILEPRSW